MEQWFREHGRAWHRRRTPHDDTIWDETIYNGPAWSLRQRRRYQVRQFHWVGDWRAVVVSFRAIHFFITPNSFGWAGQDVQRVCTSLMRNCCLHTDPPARRDKARTPQTRTRLGRRRRRRHTKGPRGLVDNLVQHCVDDGLSIFCHFEDLIFSTQPAVCFVSPWGQIRLMRNVPYLQRHH